MNDELIKLVLDGEVDEFLTLIRIYNKDANLVGKMVTLWRNEFATKTKKSLEEIKSALSERALENILILVRDEKLDSGDVKAVMMKIAEGVKFDEAIKVEKISDDEVEKLVRKIVKEKPGLREGAYMGIVMKEFKGKVDARKAAEIVKRILGQ